MNLTVWFKLYKDQKKVKVNSIVQGCIHTWVIKVTPPTNKKQRNHYENLVVSRRGEEGIAPGRAGYKELVMFNFLT